MGGAFALQFGLTFRCSERAPLCANENQMITYVTQLLYFFGLEITISINVSFRALCLAENL